MPTILMLIDFVPNQERTFETFLLHVTKKLSKAGWRTMFIFSGEPSDSFSACLRLEGADYRINKFPLNQESYETLTASVNDLSPSIMISMFMSCFNRYLLKLKKNLGIHYWLFHDHTSGSASKKSTLKLLLAVIRGRFYGRKIDRILAVSEFVAKRNIEQSYFPKSRVKVLWNGVDLNRFQPQNSCAVENQKIPMLVFVGQLIPAKGVFTLLRAMRILSELPEPLTPKLIIAGRGKLEADLRNYSIENNLNNVIFMGQVDDVASLYRSATIVVIPSEWEEAFGLVVAEAMACGACVLASDAGSIPDVVGRNEEGGRLFKSGDAEDLAAKMIELLKNAKYRNKIGQQACVRVNQLFSLDKMVDGFVDEVMDVAI